MRGGEAAGRGADGAAEVAAQLALVVEADPRGDFRSGRAACEQLLGASDAQPCTARVFGPGRSRSRDIIPTSADSASATACSISSASTSGRATAVCSAPSGRARGSPASSCSASGSPRAARPAACNAGRTRSRAAVRAPTSDSVRSGCAPARAGPSRRSKGARRSRTARRRARAPRRAGSRESGAAIPRPRAAAWPRTACTFLAAPSCQFRPRPKACARACCAHGRPERGADHRREQGHRIRDCAAARPRGLHRAGRRARRGTRARRRGEAARRGRRRALRRARCDRTGDHRRGGRAHRARARPTRRARQQRGHRQRPQPAERVRSRRGPPRLRRQRVRPDPRHQSDAAAAAPRAAGRAHRDGVERRRIR